MQNVKKVGIPIATIATALMLMAPALMSTGAFAVGPTSTTRSGGLHFVGSPDVTATKTATKAFLTATGEVAGAGPTAKATLTANVEIVRTCTNKGGNEPPGLVKSFTTTTGSQTFETRSGRGTFSVSTNSIDLSQFSPCPPGQKSTDIAVTFTDITLTITSQTGTITAKFPDIDP